MLNKTTVLIICLFILIAGSWGFTEANGMLADMKISKAPVFTEAKIVESDSYTRTKKGRTTVRYTIVYSFFVDNQEFKRKISLVNGEGEKAVERGVLDIAYYKENPNVNKLASNYDSQSSMSGMIWALLKLSLLSLGAAAFAGFILALKFGWLKKDEPVAQS
ncbi:hypothetical protein [Microbulbifer variabilis]|uniref:hypothetical protein n=1 Tax=Microbulbifer variabilis TaxID=266805 RepID=UPI001CFED4AF|nr:hypothetical protein [Microbulbifer variabilis]